jgi:hypothetical protein
VETVEKRLSPFCSLKKALGKDMENTFVSHAFSLAKFPFEGSKNCLPVPFRPSGGCFLPKSGETLRQNA